MTYSGGPLDNQTWQTEWSTVPLAKVQLCEKENQTLEAFVVASRFYAKFDCPVACQNCPLLATVHDCETDFTSYYNHIFLRIVAFNPGQ